MTGFRKIGNGLDRLRSAALDLVDRFSGAGPWHDGDRIAGDGKNVGIAFLGCGFVADFYALNLKLHENLRLAGSYDRDEVKCRHFCSVHGGRQYGSLEEMLGDKSVEIVVNLTNPSQHFVTTKAALEAGKNVYCEKPLATSIEDAAELIRIAKHQGVQLSGAPCISLAPSLQAFCSAIREGLIGQPRLVYAELDDGPIHLMDPGSWESPNGMSWPWRDEFQTGCTMEHAGYHLAWMTKLFGQAESVTAFAACTVPDKHPDLPADAVAPDVSIASITFQSGVIARMSCSILAPPDHSVRVIGDLGVLSLDNIWHSKCAMRLQRYNSITMRAQSYDWIRRHSVARWIFGVGGKRLAASPRVTWRQKIRRHDMDYALGIADLANALSSGREPALSGDALLHVTELTLAIASSATANKAIILATAQGKAQAADALPNF
ncbi:Gfo/Idh/MocA family oxidoreductase [Sphingobium phenoxybenzoativorans]|uniref:Gfo/Idh/MocA family oxidoreductase n=1 Tax=Sphingobium phenoxybenzoativorans TaxID=1592790 RepID=A0A975K916_9SPHN|nr:Gfo/Idh/MocA family oxidoreductase [Sphingobium phenoxybenzoativorans]QUT05677.1 Gfo/Idh/MocA family oxidoreductase [Sphingobium phenoxybenzoativorans]